VLGALTGAAVVSKFSSLVYLPAVWIGSLTIYLLLNRPGFPSLQRRVRLLLPSIAAAGAVCLFVMWGAYRFSFGHAGFTSLPLPMPGLFAGIEEVAKHNQGGHPSFLLGANSQTGFLMFFPVALAVKTPAGFLLLLPLAAWALIRRRREAHLWIPLVFSGCILAVGMSAHINIGIRHILPIYCGLAVFAAGALAPWLRNPRGPMTYVAGALIVWMLASSLANHPQYLAYFNEFAGPPGDVLVDSDLDWGQDMLRLAERCHELHIDHLAYTPFFPLEPKLFGFPPLIENRAEAPEPGWNAVSYSEWKLGRLDWPYRVEPNERIGRSILLYDIRPDSPLLHRADPVKDLLRDLRQRK
jgi:hypothetical protein